MTDDVDVPDELLNDDRQIVTAPCHGCGEEMPPEGTSPDQHGHVVYKWRMGSTRRQYGVERANWHIDCVVECSPRFEDAGVQRHCPNCDIPSRWRPVDAGDPTQRHCVWCSGNFTDGATREESLSNAGDGHE